MMYNWRWKRLFITIRAVWVLDCWSRGLLYFYHSTLTIHSQLLPTPIPFFLFSFFFFLLINWSLYGLMHFFPDPNYSSYEQDTLDMMITTLSIFLLFLLLIVYNCSPLHEYWILYLASFLVSATATWTYIHFYITPSGLYWVIQSSAFSVFRPFFIDPSFS